MTESTMNIEENPTFSALVEAVKSDINVFRDAESAYVAASGDREQQVQAFIETSQDEQAVKIREALKTLTTKLRDLAESSVKTSEVSEDEKAKLLKARNESRKQVKDTVDAVRMSAALWDRKFNAGAVDAFNAWLDSYGNPLKSRMPSGTGSTLPKVPVEIRVLIPETDEKPEHYQDFHNFTAYATWRGTDTKTVQEEAAQAAGLAHSELSRLSEPVTYQVQRGALTLQVTVSPKATKPRGRRPADPAKSE